MRRCSLLYALQEEQVPGFAAQLAADVVLGSETTHLRPQQPVLPVAGRIIAVQDGLLPLQIVCFRDKHMFQRDMRSIIC